MPDDPTTSSDVVTITSIDTEYTADSIEWCPYPQYSDVLLCGTYQLVNNDSNSTGTGDQGLGGQSQKGCRKGRLNAYLLNEDFKAGDSSALRRIAHTEMSGILDIKWNHLCDDLKPLFSVVDSDGCLSLWQLSTRDDEYSDVKTVDRLKIERIESVCLGINKLALSLDWSDRVEKSSPKIVSSDSQGMISLVDVNTYDLTVASQWKAHDFEAWIAAFNYWNTNIIYTGGDDCLFKGWDTRLPTDCVLFTNRRHSAGVCSIQCHPKNDHILATGSYDEHVFIWDTRQLKRPISETRTGGGVWRIKWDPWQANYLLTASMYNGFHILDCSSINESGQEIICSYMDHGSIAYGADWCCKHYKGVSLKPTTDDKNSDCMAPEESSVAALLSTCSFYDHLMNVWLWNGHLSGVDV